MAEEKDEKPSMLVKQEKYLEAGIHIGTKMHTFDMKKYVFKTRDDGLHILNLRETDARLRQTAKMLARYRPEDVLVVASRTYSGNAAAKFSALTGVSINRGRFIPGTMTNIALPNFREPKLLFVSDPKNEHEAIMEAAKVGVPVIALCDTDNETKYIDYVIPANNKGRKSLALIFFILSRELMMAQGRIASYDQFSYDTSYFEELEEIKKVDAEAGTEQEPEPDEPPKAAEPKEPKDSKKDAPAPAAS